MNRLQYYVSATSEILSEFHKFEKKIFFGQKKILMIEY